jgi:predicted PurR-regulated permease PerM
MHPNSADSAEEKGKHGGAAVTVNISNRTIFIVFAILIVIWLAFRLTDFLLVVFLGVLLATSIDRPISWLQSHGVPRSVGVIAVLVVLIALLAALIAALVPLLSAEAQTLKDDVPKYTTRLQNFLNRFSATNQSNSQLSLSRITTQITNNLNTIASQLTSVTITVGHTLVLIFVTFVLAFFLAVDPDLVPRFLTRFSPRPWHSRAIHIYDSARVRIGAWARGQLIIAVTFGLLMGLALWALGVPYAATLGTLAGVLEIIPYLGGAVTVVLATAMALSVGVPQAIGVVVVYIVLVNLEAHVLSPVLFGHAVGLPSVAILLALLAGIELLGIVGALIAVPGTVIIWGIVEEIWPSSRPPERRPPGWMRASRRMRGGTRRDPAVKTSD